MKNYNQQTKEVEQSQIDNLPEEAKKLFTILGELEDFTVKLKSKLLEEFSENNKDIKS